MSKESFYFSHDYNARNDPRLMRLVMKYGMSGIGIYWCVIEMLYEQGGRIPLVNIESIAFELRTECDCIKSILQDFDLFKFKDDIFYSDSVLRRLKARNEKSEGARESALRRWYPDKYKDANAMQTQCDSNAIKKRKEKERKGKKIFIAPTIEEVVKYFVENKYTKEAGQKAFNYYSVADWKDSNGKPVLNWKQKMINVWFKSENEDTSKKMPA